MSKPEGAQPAQTDGQQGTGTSSGTSSGSGSGRALGEKGARTRRRLLEAAEQVFADLGYHDASIVKITEAAGVSQGTFYLYFACKQEVFDVLVEDLNSRLRHAMSEASAKGVSRIEAERLGFAAF
ncbi:MAG: TetR/AcrR family transcriptional regulator, partial [Trebonia sp.]